jgi:hypothetical protein
MGFLKRTAKKFDYQPRYYKGNGNPFKISHKFDEFRTTVGKSKGLKNKFSDAVDELKAPDETGSRKTILIIITVLLLIFLFIIDFDISIFYS